MASPQNEEPQSHGCCQMGEGVREGTAGREGTVWVREAVRGQTQVKGMCEAQQHSGRACDSVPE